MPSYPTGKPRDSRSAPAPKSPGKGRLSSPKPANDNPRRPTPRPPKPGKPANDNPGFRPPRNPAAPGSFGKRGFRYRRFARNLIPPPLRYFEWGYRTIIPIPWGPFTPPPSGWFLRHGPNRYTGRYAFAPTDWEGGYVRSSDPTGPQTGLITGQARGKPEATAAAWIAKNPTRTQLGFWIPVDGDPGATRVASALAFNKNSGVGYLPAAALKPNPYPVSNPFTDPQVYPDPLTEPPFLPRFTPLPRFNPAANSKPWFDPFAFPAELSPAPLQNPAPLSKPSYVPNGYAKNFPMRGPSSRPSSRPGPRHHAKRPPRVNEKEGKTKAREALDKIADALGKVTEAMDLVGAAWDALPDSAKSRSFFKGKEIEPSFKKKLNDVWNNWDKVRYPDFLKNVIQNQLEDYVGGKFGDYVDQVFNKGPGPKNGRPGVSRTSRVGRIRR